MSQHTVLIFENTVWYRLLKVVYFFGWLLILLTVCFIFLSTKNTIKNEVNFNWGAYQIVPHLSVLSDNDLKAYLNDHMVDVSPAGRNYLAGNINKIAYVQEESQQTWTMTPMRAKVALAEMPSSQKSLQHSQPSLDEFLGNSLKSLQENSSVQLTLSGISLNSWFKIFLESFIWLVCLSLFWETIKNIVMYIIVGQKFSYMIVNIFFRRSAKVK